MTGFDYLILRIKLILAISICIYFMSPQPKGGGDILLFGADPVGVGVASFPCVIF